MKGHIQLWASVLSCENSSSGLWWAKYLMQSDCFVIAAVCIPIKVFCIERAWKKYVYMALSQRRIAQSF